MSASVVSKVDLEQLVAEADVGGRKPSGLPAKAIMLVAVAWSLFQLWYCRSCWASASSVTQKRARSI
jgi:TRAP-type uncharacterized transport system fused permease subunit